MAVTAKHNGAKESLYDRDFHRWALEQAQALRARRWNELDVENVAEEVEDLARSLQRELQSDLAVILAHLLKWAFQPAKRSSSWEATIAEHRERVRELMQDNPSLAGHVSQRFDRAYTHGRLRALREMKLARKNWKLLPERCPWSLEQVLDPEFYPEAPGR